MATEYLTVDHLNTKELTRIFSKIRVNPITGCWEWQGSKCKGYGNIRYKGKVEKVHRLLYAWLVKPLPRGLARHIPQLDHLICNNPPCCLPSHTKLVLGRSNILRSVTNPAAVNSRKTHCKNGHLLVESNLVGNNKRKRACKTCHNSKSKAYYRENKQKVLDRAKL